MLNGENNKEAKNIIWAYMIPFLFVRVFNWDGPVWGGWERSGPLYILIYKDNDI